jgi:hypothetical protein
MIPSRTVIMRIAEPRPRRTVLGDAPMGSASMSPNIFPMQGVQRLDRCAGFSLDHGPRRPAAASCARWNSVATAATGSRPGQKVKTK